MNKEIYGLPDDECTLWFNGIPKFLGGIGDEWIHCCLIHDYTTSTWPWKDLELCWCVMEAGFVGMALVMLAGLTALGVPLRLYWRVKRKHKEN